MYNVLRGRVNEGEVLSHVRGNRVRQRPPEGRVGGLVNICGEVGVEKLVRFIKGDLNLEHVS